MPFRFLIELIEADADHNGSRRKILLMAYDIIFQKKTSSA